MIQTLNPNGSLVSRRIVGQIALIISISTLLLALSISSVSGSEEITGIAAGSPVADGGASSLSEDQGTTGETQVGSTDDDASPTPTPTPTSTTTTDDEAGDPPETTLDEGEETGTDVSTGEVGATTQELEASPVAEGVEAADEPVLHPLVVTVFNCETDPGDAPLEHPDCTIVEAAGVVVQVDSVEIGNQPTDASGQASFDVEEGATAVISQDAATLADGYSPRGDGVIEVLVEGAAQAQLINLADLETQGRFQISNQQCFTSDEPYTEFLPVIGPMVRAASADCIGPLAGADYTVTGGSLAEPLVLTTDDGGGWTGYLDPGDYTIARAGASTEFSVVVNQITVVLTVDWITGAKGAVGVQRYTCSEGEVSGTVITLLDGGGGGPPNESCVASDANVQLYTSGSLAEPLNLSGNGTEVQVAVGDYVVRDITGVEQALSVTEGGFIQALIIETRLTGVVSAQINVCSDPSSNFEDPTQPGYWSANCGPAAAGAYVGLLDTAGKVVASTQTVGDGLAYFEGILAGTYALDVAESCALFADGSDARAGFTVAPNQVVDVASYECAKPSNPPDGGGNDGGSPGGDGSIGDMPDQLISVGDSRPEDAPGQSSELFVTTLPSTGVGQGGGSILGAAILLLAAVTGFAAVRTRTALPARRTLPVRPRK